MRRFAHRLILLAAVLGTTACDWPQPGSFIIDSPKQPPGTRVRTVFVPDTLPSPVPTARPPVSGPVAGAPGGAGGQGSGAGGAGDGSGGAGDGSGSGGATNGVGGAIGTGSSTGSPPGGTGPEGDGVPNTRPSLEPDCKRARFHNVQPPTGASLGGGFSPTPAQVTVALRLVDSCFPITIVAVRLTYVFQNGPSTTSLVPVIVRLQTPVLLSPSLDSSDGPATAIPVALQSLQLEPFLKGLPTGTTGELTAQVQFIDPDGATVQNADGNLLTVAIPVDR